MDSLPFSTLTIVDGLFTKTSNIYWPSFLGIVGPDIKVGRPCYAHLEYNNPQTFAMSSCEQGLYTSGEGSNEHGEVKERQGKFSNLSTQSPLHVFEICLVEVPKTRLKPLV